MNYVRHNFSLLPCGVNTLKNSFQFSARKCPFFIIGFTNINVSHLRNLLLSLQRRYLCRRMAVFQLALLEEARNFLRSVPPQAHKKILYYIWRVAGGEKNSELFKKLENSDIWEFRTLYNGTAYRLFAFWDTGTQTFVVATHGIIKKTQKTPKKEIARAEAIMKQYFELKKYKL